MGMVRRGKARQGRDLETTPGVAPPGGAMQGKARQGLAWHGFLIQTTNHRSTQQVRWRLIPAANDSPVVFQHMKDRHMSDRFLVMARFSVDDIPIMACDTIEEAKAVATDIARDPAVLLTTYGGVFHALSIHSPDIVNLAAATVLRLREGRTVDAVCWTIIPGEQE